MLIRLAPEGLCGRLTLIVRRILKIVLAVVCTALPLAGSASEYKRDENGTPASAKELPSAMDLKEDAEQKRGIWQQRLNDWDALPGFLRESNVEFKSRTYQIENKVDGDRIAKSLATGGELSLVTGALRGWQIGASYFASLRLIADSGKLDTLLLGRGRDDINVLGKAFVRYQRENLQLNLYRQEIDLPYLNKQDSRMIPNTFEGYTLSYGGTSAEYFVAHVAKIKRRNDGAFETMAEAAGADSDKGLSTIGARYTFSNGVDVGAIVLNGWDVLRTVYAEANWLYTLPRELQYKVSLQFTDQRSVGDELVGQFDTWTWGARGVLSYKNALFSASYTQTSKDAGIISPYGGRPSFNSLMLRNFDRAGEKAWRIGVSYEFSLLGVDGLGLSVQRAQGSNAISQLTGSALNDRSEWNISVEYQPGKGFLYGLWLRLRYATVDEKSGSDGNQLRLILNYDIPLS